MVNSASSPTHALLTNATTTVTGEVVAGGYSGRRTIQGTVEGTGAVSATIPIYVSNDANGWILAGTITLSGTTKATDGFVIDAPWQFYRADVTAISGTNASADVTMGI